VVLYFIFGGALMFLESRPSSPMRGHLSLDYWLLFCTLVAFLFLTFWMIDTARLCAWFIRRLSHVPTAYPEATLRHFARERSIEDQSLLDEWIDTQLIADLTEPVGHIVYWPFLGFLLLLLARNSWWDHWTWPWPLVAIFGINIALTSASYIILRRAALDAQKAGVESLKVKVGQKQRQVAPSVLVHESNQATMLLEEINNVRRGAFAPLSKNPLVGGLLVNSSGVVLIELLIMFFSK